MKYPIGIQDFESVIRDGFTYIDKTEIIHKLVTSGKSYFLSRPRRFGKSLLLSTLKCYYENKRELFKGLAIDTLQPEPWEEHPVIHMSFAGGYFVEDGMLNRMIEGMLSDCEKKYGVEDRKQDITPRFIEIIRAARMQTGKRVVVLIDEYDKPLLDTFETTFMHTKANGEKESLCEHHRTLLKQLYSAFKDADADLQLVLLVGVTKFSQISIFSGFNQPNDISMDPRYEAICGITEDELYTCFGERLRELAEQWGVDVDNVKYELKKKYDGYHFSLKNTDIYNPFSLLNALSKGIADDYWFKTGNPEYLIRLIQSTKLNIQELVGKRYTVSEFIDYKADDERPLPMIYQSGYLTIKEYSPLSETYKLDFPNVEVARGFLPLLTNSYLKTKQHSSTSLMAQVVEALGADNLDEVRDALTAFFASIPYTAYRRKGMKAKEQHFHYTFYLLMRILSTYLVYTEKCQSQGRVDCVIETHNNIYIFEFKLDGTADEALQQIEDKGYATEYLTDPRPLRKIGCVFLSKNGTIGEWKVN